MQLEVNASLFVEPETLDWQDEAACLNYKLLVDEEGRTNPFFSYDKNDLTEALIICKSCPVRLECLRTALSYELKYDWAELDEIETVYGGYTSAERRRIFKKFNLLQGLA